MALVEQFTRAAWTERGGWARIPPEIDAVVLLWAEDAAPEDDVLPRGIRVDTATGVVWPEDAAPLQPVPYRLYTRDPEHGWQLEDCGADTSPHERIYRPHNWPKRPDADRNEAGPATPPTEPIRGYVHTNAAWYADAVLAPDHPGEVLFGLYHADGSTAGELRMEWSMPRDQVIPALHGYDDAWAVLVGFADVLAALASVTGQHIGPAPFCAMLDRLGFTDLTERVRRA